MVPTNFGYLAHHDARLAALGSQAEEHFAADPTVTLFKLRQFGEVLAQRAAAKVGLFVAGESQQALIDRLHERGAIGATQRTLFHDLRRVGNRAVHEGIGDHPEALHQLRMARELAIWFQRSFGNDRKFDPGPFVPPASPAKAEGPLQEEMDRLRADVAARQKELDDAQAAILAATRAAEAAASAKLTAEERAEKARQDAKIWEELASGETAALAAQNQKLLAELAALQAAAEAAPPRQVAQTIAAAGQASEAIHLDEAATRKIIDRQLEEAGWEVDTAMLRHSRGARPERGKNRAIAEWPTEKGPVDYALFLGTTCVALVEAKREARDVPAVLEQAKRYSLAFTFDGAERHAEGTAEAKLEGYRVPFLFATNGRPFLRQLVEKSGIWFLDARRRQNAPRALDGWYSPEGLKGLLAQDVDRADAQLRVEPMPYIDRDYQRAAIRAVEAALEAGQRALLLAMATGTGKTRTCIGLCYRLIKTKRFRRVLFLVDRTSLGEQVRDALSVTRFDNLQTLPDIFDVRTLVDASPEPETRFHIATIQAMVLRILGGEDPPSDLASGRRPTAVDQYDCIVVDECHRGYVLDRDLSERELLFRDEADYISKYRRVLDHFDAVKIGLTATPALHTQEIFGAPVFTYGYREAVIDGYLIDHEPPIRIVTKLAHDGIHFEANTEALVLDRTKNTIQKELLADEQSFEVESFNRKVITENFNRAVLGAVAREIDPAGDEKTLIFCATDEHADLVVRLLNEIFAEVYGEVDHDAVQKITGSADKPSQKIRYFKNEKYPSVAVTVDLMTTGIDVPRLVNLVFLRRVRSRILYEQMLGRATRLCAEIGKERFRIFDAVDLYAALQDVTDMKPVVVNPSVTFAQLAAEIGSDAVASDREISLEEFLAKLQGKKRTLKDVASLTAAAGTDFPGLIAQLRAGTVDEAAEFLTAHPQLPALLDRYTAGTRKTLIATHADEIHEIAHDYGAHKRPDDYLDSFRAYVTGNLNRLPALIAVTTRPRDLTRDDLKALKLALDDAGYNEATLRAAWKDLKNEDIAATVIGYIRQLALGSPLVPYAERVDRAVARFKKANKLTGPQLQWLDRIAKQMKIETIVDREALNRGQFRESGGFPKIDKIFEGKLGDILGELTDSVWSDVG